MLIQYADVDLPLLVHLVGNAGGGKNIECKILALSAGNIGVTVDPAETETARAIRNDPAARLNEIISHPEVQAKVMVLDPLQDWLRYGADVKLVVTTQPTSAVDHAPAHPPGHELRRDLVIARRIEYAKEITRFHRKLEPRRIERRRILIRAPFPGERSRTCQNKQRHHPSAP